MQPDPLQLPHSGENIILCSLQVHLVLLLSVWQLKPDYMYSSSSGAGGRSVSIGFLHFLSSTGERSSAVRFPLLYLKVYTRRLEYFFTADVGGKV